MIRFPLAAAVCALGLALPACSDDADPCAVPHTVEQCACAGGMQGARVCSAEHAWGTCDCSGAIALPNAIEPMPHAGNGGAGGSAGMPAAGTGGRQGAGSGGSAPMAGSGGTGVDDDGGIDMPDAGGSGGMGGEGGEGGTGGVMATDNPYSGCTTAADCTTPGAECVITMSFPANASVCAPMCVETADCPVPEGMYEAALTCVTPGYCALDCTPVLFGPLKTCPTGMTCISGAFGISYCHDDGM
jgi:hypothetical protein